jgi:hypothetical protein
MKIANPLAENNVFKLNLEGATLVQRAKYQNGYVEQYSAFQRDGKTLPVAGVFGIIGQVLQRHSELDQILAEFNQILASRRNEPEFQTWFCSRLPSTFEAMIATGWIDARYNPAKPLIPAGAHDSVMHWHSQA